jgi:hypothetical protein
MSASIQIMLNSGDDIKRLFEQIPWLTAEEPILVKTKTAIYLAKLSFEESLKVSSIEETPYSILADQVDSLILQHRCILSDVRAFYARRNATRPRYLNREIFRELHELRACLGLIDRRLKTIHVWSDAPRRRSYPTGGYNCWVDAEGYRVRDPELAVNVPAAVSSSPPRKPRSAQCPGAPEKTKNHRMTNLPEPIHLFDVSEPEPEPEPEPVVAQCPREDSFEGDDDEEDEYPECAAFESRKTIQKLALRSRRLNANKIQENTPPFESDESSISSASEASSSFNEDEYPECAAFESRKPIQKLALRSRRSQVVSPEKNPKTIPASETRFNEFKDVLLTLFAKFKKIKNETSSLILQPSKLASLCKISKTVSNHILDNTEFIRTDPIFKKIGPLSNRAFINACVDKGAVLAKQIEDAYTKIRNNSMRSDPNLRKIKNETIQLLNQVSSTMHSL